MSNVVESRSITAWLVALLQTGMPQTPVGRNGKVPQHTRQSGYLMVHRIYAGETWGAPLVAPDQNADLIYQVDAVSQDADHAEYLSGRAGQTILARTATGAFQVTQADPAPYVVADRQPFGEGGQIEATKATDLVSWPARYTLRVVGA